MNVVTDSQFLANLITMSSHFFPVEDKFTDYMELGISLLSSNCAAFMLTQLVESGKSFHEYTIMRILLILLSSFDFMWTFSTFIYDVVIIFTGAMTIYFLRFL